MERWPANVTAEQVCEQAWSMLRSGADDREAAFHTPVLASVDETGQPQVRTVVLRRVDTDRAELFFHTDLRSPKVRQLRRDDRVSMLFYDAAARVQLRISGHARLHSLDPVADGQWQSSHPMSRQCYRSAAAPSAALPEDAISPGQIDADGYDNFCAIAVLVGQIDFLHLHHAGHRRVRIDRQGRAWVATNLAP